MNFLEFLGIFLEFSYFYEFIWIYFELKIIQKIIFLLHANLAADVSWAKRHCHMVAYKHLMRSRMWLRICARVCACVSTCVHVCVSD